VDSNEGIWNTGKEEFPSLGYKIRHKEGLFTRAAERQIGGYTQ